MAVTCLSAHPYREDELIDIIKVTYIIKYLK